MSIILEIIIDKSNKLNWIPILKLKYTLSEKSKEY